MKEHTQSESRVALMLCCVCCGEENPHCDQCYKEFEGNMIFYCDEEGETHLCEKCYQKNDC